MNMWRGLMVGVMYFGSSAAWPCTEAGTFGFKFGDPVPAHVGKNHVGGSVQNAMGCSPGSVPTPMPGFESYNYCSNRDRKFVYAIEALHVYADGKVYDAGQPDAAEMEAKVVAAIAAARQDWEARFGFKFTSDYAHGLSWTAETPKLRANIGVRGPHIVVECTHRELESKAMDIAFKSWK
jgi:hypothetical protein